jgi:hydrogenase maturation protein HypF
MPTKGARIIVGGQVQGLGFRPYVFRLAAKLGLRGSVSNTGSGVEIAVEGANVNAFVAALKNAPPRLARISTIKVRPARPSGRSGFEIKGSDVSTPRSPSAVDILPDLTCCPACRLEIFEQGNRRQGYAFTNCTECGPRYSIVQSLPYDRPRTTMKDFKMCPDCQAEYDNPADRRFHAQPNCCPACGPKLSLLHANGELFDESNPLGTAIKLLADGKILAIKSLGGFHLACDGLNEGVVKELRKRKHRPDKPLAMMCADVDMVKRFCRVDSESRALLKSAARPIVLLPRSKRPAPGWEIAPSVAPGMDFLGVMLAYAPLHYLLFQPQGSTPALRALVMTSANAKDEPVAFELPELIARLGPVVDYILTHDRPIANRCDDSVAFAPPGVSVRNRADSRKSSPPLVIVRRSRGFAPSPVPLNPKRFKLKPVLACGAELKSTFALGNGSKVYLSPHIGDLSNASSLEFFEQALDSYKRWFNIKPEVIACDLHPDLLATRFGENLALKSHRPLVRVQHHHAHIASVIAEHDLDEPVLGVALDGTGLGVDGKIWGCELLRATRRDFQRLGHLRYLPLVGGEAAIMEPSRIAAGYLVYLFGDSALARAPGLAGQSASPNLLLQPNVVFTSSAGRLFDAVSALTGICPKASYDGQAPALLEAVADPKDRVSYFNSEQLRYDLTNMLIIDPAPWLNRALDDLGSGLGAARLSRRFHTTFVQAIVEAARRLAKANRIKTVCLSGGTFQNRILLAEISRGLLKHGLSPFFNHAVPVNDGGVAFGQAIVADAVAHHKPVGPTTCRAGRARK